MENTELFQKPVILFYKLTILTVGQERDSKMDVLIVVKYS